MTTSLPNAHQKKICFLIEDDPDDQNIFLMALTTFNSSIELVIVSDGVKALKKINEDESFLPDYIFLDLNMPYMSGKECLIKLRAIDRLSNVPIIIYSTVKYFGELTSFGASGFVSKPISMKDIIKTLDEILK